MGNCLFLKPNDKNIKTPRQIKDNIDAEVIKNHIDLVLDPLQPIDLVIDDTIPNSLINNLRKKDSEFSLESPNIKSPTNYQIQVFIYW